MPGAAALLRGLADAGVATAIVTSATSPWVAMALGEVLATDGGPATVDVQVTAEDVACGKPDPQGFLLACERLGVPPQQALGVEDSPAGVAAARAAGVGRVLGVSTTHPAELLLAAGADVVLRALPAPDEVPSLS
jgi:sugar-phosphatase